MTSFNEMTRRQLFQGMIAASFAPCLPDIPVLEPVEPVLKRTSFNPFAVGSADSLTRMVVAVMEQVRISELVTALANLEGFSREILKSAAPGQTVGDFLTKVFGEGEWSGLVSPVEEIENEFVRAECRQRSLPAGQDVWRQKSHSDKAKFLVAMPEPNLGEDM